MPFPKGLRREEEIGPEREAAVVPRFDDHDLDEHLKRPDVELLDALLQDVKVLLRRPDQQGIRELVGHDRDWPREDRGLEALRWWLGCGRGSGATSRWHHIPA